MRSGDAQRLVVEPAEKFARGPGERIWSGRFEVAWGGTPRGVGNMFARILSHLRQQPLALLALFVALGGTSYAALAKNSVGTKQLKKNAVTSPKVRNRSLTGSDLKKKSVTGANVLESTLAKVPSSAAADASLNSAKLGGKPPAGYVSRIVTRTKTLHDLTNGDTVGDADDGGTGDGTVRCHSGEHVIGGGVRIASSGPDQAVVTSRPVAPGSSLAVPVDGSTTANGWRGVAADDGSDPGDNPGPVQVFAICAS